MAIVLKQFVKYNTVGVMNTLIDFVILNALMIGTGIVAGLGFTLFKSMSFMAAVTNSYFLNKYWTFQSKTGSNLSEFSRFLGISMASFLLNVGTASFIVNTVKPLAGATPIAWANIGALAASVTSVLWNFIGYKFLVFRRVGGRG